MVGKTHQICTQHVPAVAFLVNLTVTLYPSFRVIQAPVLKYSNHIPISGPLNLLLCPPEVPSFSSAEARRCQVIFYLLKDAIPDHSALSNFPPATLSPIILLNDFITFTTTYEHFLSWFTDIILSDFARM